MNNMIVSTYTDDIGDLETERTYVVFKVNEDRKSAVDYIIQLPTAAPLCSTHSGVQRSTEDKAKLKDSQMIGGEMFCLLSLCRREQKVSEYG
ncbi:hypothetical protein NQZ68_008788, partial [Dissostichus eleginoides]